MITAISARRYAGLHAQHRPILCYPKIVARLDAFFDNPSIETWTDTYLIIIGGNLVTFWRAVCAVSPSFPRALGTTGVWTRFPDELTARRALKYAARLAQKTSEHG